MTHYDFIVSLLHGIDTRIRCKRVFGPIGVDCEVEPWTVSFGPVEVQLPLRIPHASPWQLVMCVAGLDSCGRTAEVYKLRRVALALHGELTTASATDAMFQVYSRGGWTEFQSIACAYGRELLYMRGRKRFRCPARLWSV